MLHKIRSSYVGEQQGYGSLGSDARHYSKHSNFRVDDDADSSSPIPQTNKQKNAGTCLSYHLAPQSSRFFILSIP
jgi:hypothetical protein